MQYKVPSWSALRALGDSKAIKLTCLTPFFGYMIIFSERFHELFMQTGSYLNLSNPKQIAISNAYFMYFGLIALGIASGLYALFAPNLTKEYKSIRNYLNENIDFSTLSKLVGLANYVKLKFTKDEPNPLFSKIESFEKTAVPTDPSYHINLRAYSIDLFSHFWNQTAYSRLYTRIIITIFYAIGFILLFIPTLRLLYNIIF